MLRPDFDPGTKLVKKAGGWYLEINVDSKWASEGTRKLVTTELLGKALVPSLPFDNPNGSPLKIDTDYFGNLRNPNNPFPGPFEVTQGGKKVFKVWPKG